jgi:hypothetical protein
MALTEPFPNVKKGPIAAGESDLITMVLAYSPMLWDAVHLTAPGTGETFPRVISSTTAAAKTGVGIIVDLLNKEPAVGGSPGVPVANVGDRCLVQLAGICKCRIGVSQTLAVNSPLEQSANAGCLQLQTVSAAGASFGKFLANAGTSSATAGDIGMILLLMASSA